MNWVGGARSRVRQQAEKKIQKDFFERKRLANKMQKFRPSLSKVKNTISQDLLFLKATAASTKSRPVSPGGQAQAPKKPLDLEQTGGAAQQGGRRPPPRPQRDLELPMSPISHTSVLDIMDTSTALSELEGSEGEPWRRGCGRSGEGGGSSGGGGGGGPRVSTQKIPHRTVLESFGPPKIEELEDYQEPRHARPCDPQEPHIVPAMDNNPLLNVSTMTESLFPPPAKRRRQQHGVGKRKSEKQLYGGADKYSLDDILNKDYHHQQQLTEENADPNKPAPLRQDLLQQVSRKSRKQEKGNRLAGNRRENCGDIFSIAKGSWQQIRRALPKKPLQQDLVAKPQLGYDFDSWTTTATSTAAAKRKPGVPHPPVVEAVSSKDGEAVLEFHYAPAAESLQQNKRRKADIERENHFKPTLTQEKLKFASRERDSFHVHKEKVMPWISSTKSTLSVLSEDPFSRRKVPQMCVGPPVSTSIDLDESIFGPLHKMAATNNAKKEKTRKEKGNHIRANINPSSLDTTESIFAPILAAKKETVAGRVAVGGGGREQRQVEQGEGGLGDKGNRWEERGARLLGNEEGGLEEEARRRLGEFGQGKEHDLGGGNRKKSTFEMMMDSIEQEQTSEQLWKRDSEESETIELGTGVNKCETGVKSNRHILEGFSTGPPPAIGHELSTATSECASLPEYGSIQALPSEGSKSMHPTTTTSKFKPGNISVLNELMFLEEEISSHYEDGLLSQNSLEEMGYSEDPLFNRPPLPKCETESALDFSQDSDKKHKSVSENLQIPTEPVPLECPAIPPSLVEPEAVGPNLLEIGTQTDVEAEKQSEIKNEGVKEHEKEPRQTTSKAVQTSYSAECSHPSSIATQTNPADCAVATSVHVPKTGHPAPSTTDNPMITTATSADFRTQAVATSLLRLGRPAPRTSDNPIAIQTYTDCKAEAIATTGDNLTIPLDLYNPWPVTISSSELPKEKPLTYSILGGAIASTQEIQDTGKPGSSHRTPTASQDNEDTTQDACVDDIKIAIPHSEDFEPSSTTSDATDQNLRKQGQSSASPGLCTARCEHEARVKELEEKLASAESTIVWQSVMIKLYQMDTKNN